MSFPVNRVEDKILPASNTNNCEESEILFYLQANKLVCQLHRCCQKHEISCQLQRPSLLMAQQAAEILVYLHQLPFPISPKEAMWTDPDNTCILRGLHYRRGILSLRNPTFFIMGSLPRETLSLLYWTISPLFQREKSLSSKEIYYTYTLENMVQRKRYSMSLLARTHGTLWKILPTDHLTLFLTTFTCPALSSLSATLHSHCAQCSSSHPPDHFALYLLAQLCASSI